MDIEKQGPADDPSKTAGDGTTPSGDGTPKEPDSGSEVDWEARAKKAEGIISSLKEESGAKNAQELRERLKPADPAPKPPETQAKAEPQFVTREEVSLKEQGFSTEEIKLVERMAGEGVPLSEAIKDPLISQAVEGIRIKKRQEKAVPAPSDRTPIKDGKAFGELPDAEKKANYGDTVEKLIQKGKGQSRTLT